VRTSPLFSRILVLIFCLIVFDIHAQTPTRENCAHGYAYDPQKSECVACNQPCDTGKLGICARGMLDCRDTGPVCIGSVEPGERVEICNREDDNCDGRIDEGFDKDGDGYTTCGGDCDDRNSQIHPDAVERCDGLDNNCNGLIDEGFNAGSSCTFGLGECAREGKLVCSKSGLESHCDAVPGRPTPEICDGKDNNCDGIIDDGLGEITCGVGACERKVSACSYGSVPQCVPGQPTVEFCGDGIDNNCDGRIDEGFEALGRECFAGVGGCRRIGKMVCSEDRRELICSAIAGKPAPEICGNVIDDDCDGEIDNAAGLGVACDNGLLGECFREGTTICDREAGLPVCSAQKISPMPERCDGQDNDCDGIVDNGVANICGGCGELPGELGAPCRISGGDECADGMWACDQGEPGGMICVLEPKKSDGRICKDDGNPCTLSVCTRGKCDHPPVLNGLECNDLNSCTIDDICFDGVCVGSARRDCDDGNKCTRDACDPVRGCYHNSLGAGVENICEGCDVLEVFPGEVCTLSDKYGICKEGMYQCLQDGGIACVQKVFPRTELCNGIDDNCSGEVDEGFGTTTCGVGECKVVIENCLDGRVTTCVPKNPRPETCANMGADDDCNGMMDDIKNLGEECPVAVGTCIVPGQFRCVGDAEFPVCVVLNPSDGEDDDGDGIVNYCDHAGSIAGGVEIDVGEAIAYGDRRGKSSSSRLYELSKTRAVILPWSNVWDSVVVAPDSPDQAMLFISGVSGEAGGLAYIRAKNITSSGSLKFQTCDAPASAQPRKLLAVGDIADLIATTEKGYVKYPKIASQMPSEVASASHCLLKGQPMPADLNLKRTWIENSKEMKCEVDAVHDISPMSALPLVAAGAVSCTVPSGSVWRKDKRVLGFDIIAESASSDESMSLEFLPVISGDGDFEDVHLSVSRTGAVQVINMTAISGGKRFFGACLKGDGGWGCLDGEIKNVFGKIIFMGEIIQGGETYVVTKPGEVFRANFDFVNKTVALVASGFVVRDKDSPVLSVFEFPMQKDRPRTMLIGLGKSINAATARNSSDGKMEMKPEGSESFLPESVVDDVFLGERLDMRRPHAFALVPLKNYGGRDMFVSFDITKGFKKIGEMGFFFFNANERPQGFLADIKFDGKKGRVRLDFEDPADDRLSYRATIRAGHGASLDSWLDGFQGGVLRFSVKGDSSGVGLWPIKIEVSASDPGGLMAVSEAVIDSEGKVEMVSSSHGETSKKAPK